MTRTEKAAAIDALKDKFSEHDFFYVTDSSALTVEQVNKLRGLCYAKEVELKVVKNTLAVKALESAGTEKGYGPLIEHLKGPTAIMFAKTSNVPAKIIKEFRTDFEKPVLKAAYIDSDVFIGDDALEALSQLKSKDELLGDIILLLQSPIKTVVASLQSGENTVAGLVKALEDRASE